MKTLYRIFMDLSPYVCFCSSSLRADYRCRQLRIHLLLLSAVTASGNSRHFRSCQNRVGQMIISYIFVFIILIQLVSSVPDGTVLSMNDQKV